MPFSSPVSNSQVTTLMHVDATHKLRLRAHTQRMDTRAATVRLMAHWEACSNTRLTILSDCVHAGLGPSFAGVCGNPVMRAELYFYERRRR